MFVYVTILWTVLVARIDEARRTENKTRGASAIEWAIIAGVSVVLAVLIGGIVYKIVDNKSSALDKCGSTDIGSGTTC
jgi:Flp pilus assembly pilin Flp